MPATLKDLSNKALDAIEQVYEYIGDTYPLVHHTMRHAQARAIGGDDDDRQSIAELLSERSAEDQVAGRVLQSYDECFGALALLQARCAVLDGLDTAITSDDPCAYLEALSEAATILDDDDDEA